MPLPKPLFVRWIKLEVTDALGAAHAFQCYVTQAGLTSTGGDPVSINTLCPEGSFSECSERAWSLAITGVQDVETLEGLQLFLLRHDGETATFLYYPKTDRAGAPVGYGFKGTVTLSPPDNVGNAASGTFATFTTTLPLQGKYTMVDSAGNPVVEKSSARPGDVFPAEPTITAEDETNANKLAALGYVANPQTAWVTDEKITVGTYEFSWNGTQWKPGEVADRGAAEPGDVFPAEPSVTAEDTTNAAKLTGLGYVALPATVWTTGQGITIGTFRFSWDGSAWDPGLAT